MYAFISTAFLICFPLLFIGRMLLPMSIRSYLINGMAVLQTTLLVYAFYLIRQLIGLYQFRKLLHMPDSNLDFIGSGLLEMCLIILLPFLFLHHAIRKSWILGGIIWALLLHTTSKQGWNMEWETMGLLQSMGFYISLVTSIYALLWLHKNWTASSTD